ncbi:MAG TPA: CDP-alcohol phosphatidyltransferase family protein [Thermomicrobiales bacterium]|nr:CDP-alcohol phosphatidyltransferase family protein [Thermomicrobiales bacterium]
MANLITVGRVAMLFGAIGMIYSRNYVLVVIAGVIIAIVFAGDGIDGWVARRQGSTSKLGAVLDIAGDRIVENALWVVVAHLGLIGVWAPLVVLSRSFTVDVMRSVALQQGKTAFGDDTMARSRITHFLTASRFSRTYYGWSKALAFVFLTWMFAWRLPGADGRFLDVAYDYQAFRALVWFLAYSSVAICVIRGLPVLYDAMYYLRDEPEADSSTPRDRSVSSTLTAERGERGNPV